MLHGRNLSRVQEFALELIMAADLRASEDAKQERFRLALVTADPERWIPVMYPKAHQAARAQAEGLDPDDPMDIEGETLQFDPDMDQDEIQDLLEQIRSGEGQMVLNQSDIEDQGWDDA